MVGTVPWEVDAHAWEGVVDSATVELYQAYARDLRLGERPVLVVVDAYNRVLGVETRVVGPNGREVSTLGCNRSISDVLSAFRSHGLPVVHVTDFRALHDGHGGGLQATNRPIDVVEGDFDFVPAARPLEGEPVIYKRRASAFFGTELHALLTELHSDSLVVIGESTSGCVRASVVDGFSAGFHVCVVEEACYDRAFLPHAVSLFDMHHKYADVVSLTTLKTLLPRTANTGRLDAEVG